MIKDGKDSWLKEKEQNMAMIELHIDALNGNKGARWQTLTMANLGISLFLTLSMILSLST